MFLFNPRLLPQWHWCWLPSLLFGLALAASTTSYVKAQETPQQVTVTLRDSANRGLDQVVVTLRMPQGNVLAEGVTDRDGTVNLSLSNPTDALRLTVHGVGATGTPLQLASSERDGISLRVGAPETTIALRVEDDGTVLPDPATMAEGAGIPLPPVPTRQPPASTSPTGDTSASPTARPRSTPAATSESEVPQPAPAEFVDANGQPIGEPSPAPSRTVLFLLALVLGLGCIAIGLWRLLEARHGGQG